MIHCWMNVAPVLAEDQESSDQDVPMGVQILLHARTDDAMIKQIGHRLAAIGATTKNTLIATTGENREIDLIEIDPRHDENNEVPEVGMIVRLFPCTENGHNLDRGWDNEPRGE